MKLFNDDMQTGQIGNFTFSGVRPEKLGSTEYTLVTMVTDTSGSLRGFEDELLAMKKAVVAACRKSPRAEFLMFRDVEFNTPITEIHGFVELSQIDPDKYVAPRCGGLTSLYDATYEAVGATNEYARTLSDNDFNVNGIVFVITDGDDQGSVQTPKAVAQESKRGVQNEWIESLNVVLVGINAQQLRAYLDNFKNDAELTQYVDAGDATPQKLAKLADFVSRSISSQSQALGTGGASQALTF